MNKHERKITDLKCVKWQFILGQIILKLNSSKTYGFLVLLQCNQIGNQKQTFNFF